MISILTQNAGLSCSSLPNWAPSVTFSPTESAGDYAQICGLLAAISVAAIVLLVQRHESLTEKDASSYYIAVALLTFSFADLIVASFLYVETSGDSSCAVGLVQESIIGPVFGLGTLSLLLSMVWLFHAHSMSRIATLTGSACFGAILLITFGYLFIGIDTYNSSVSPSALRAHPRSAYHWYDSADAGHLELILGTGIIIALGISIAIRHRFGLRSAYWKGSVAALIGSGILLIVLEALANLLVSTKTAPLTSPIGTFPSWSGFGPAIVAELLITTFLLFLAYPPIFFRARADDALRGAEVTGGVSSRELAEPESDRYQRRLRRGRP